METAPQRKRRAGIAVHFVTEDEREELWRARMEVLPNKNDRVGLASEGEISTWYKVENQVRWEFEYDSIEYEGEERVAPYANFSVVIPVSEV